MKHYVGLDVSLKETAICVVDENGVVIREGKALSEPEAIVTWLNESGLPIVKIGIEGTGRLMIRRRTEHPRVSNS